MHKKIRLGGALLAAAIAAPSVFAVGAGVPYAFTETPIPGAAANVVFPDSEDDTYHACLTYVGANDINEVGYAWISSYQAPGTVLPSQINHFLANGYQKYVRFR